MRSSRYEEDLAVLVVSVSSTSGRQIQSQ